MTDKNQWFVTFRIIYQEIHLIFCLQNGAHFSGLNVLILIPNQCYKCNSTRSLSHFRALKSELCPNVLTWWYPGYALEDQWALVMKSWRLVRTTKFSLEDRQCLLICEVVLWNTQCNSNTAPVSAPRTPIACRGTNVNSNLIEHGQEI